MQNIFKNVKQEGKILLLHIVFFLYNIFMFNSLYGKITAKLPQTIYLENNGIEWGLLVPESSVNALPHVGEEARIFTHLIHKEDSMTLLGFASLEDRAIFLDLLKVEGVAGIHFIFFSKKIIKMQISIGIYCFINSIHFI